MDVIINPAKTRLKADKNLPITKSRSFKGRVAMTSMVPIFFSRAIKLMVIAGIKKRYTKGTMLNKDLMSD